MINCHQRIIDKNIVVNELGRKGKFDFVFLVLFIL